MRMTVLHEAAPILRMHNFKSILRGFAFSGVDDFSDVINYVQETDPMLFSVYGMHMTCCRTGDGVVWSYVRVLPRVGGPYYEVKIGFAVSNGYEMNLVTTARMGSVIRKGERNDEVKLKKNMKAVNNLVRKISRFSWDSNDGLKSTKEVVKIMKNTDDLYFERDPWNFLANV